MDDEEDVRNVVGELLDHIGYTSACARGGVEAVRMFEAAAFGFKGVVPKLYRFEELARVLHKVIAGTATLSTPATCRGSS